MAALVSLPVLCKKSLWLGSFFFMFLAGSAQLTSFNFHHLTTANGLSNSTIRSIAQDKYGFIWIGTLNGLNIFNGYSVKSFYKSEDPGGLPGLAVTALCKDNVGIMWVGTRLALSYFEYESGNFVRCTKDSIAINEIAIADKDHLWIVSNKGVYVLNIHTKQMVPFDQKAITKNRVTHLFQNSNGNIYFGTTKGLHVYNAGTGFYKEFYFSGLAGDSIVNSFVVDRNNDTWISVGSVDNRLIKLPADLQTVQVLPPIPRNPHNATPSSIAQILLDKAGKLWMTTS